jgi:hypothetical protein
MRRFLDEMDITDVRDFVAVALFLIVVAVAAALGSGA